MTDRIHEKDFEFENSANQDGEVKTCQELGGAFEDAGIRLRVVDDVTGWDRTAQIDASATGADLLDLLVEDSFIDTADRRILAQSKKAPVLVDTAQPLAMQIPRGCDTVHLIEGEKITPLSALFLGPKAENSDILTSAINEVMMDYIYWRKNYFPMDCSAIGSLSREKSAPFLDDFQVGLMDMLNELKEGFPFHSPRYMGHMLSGQTLPAIVGYFAGMLYNPNNVTDEAAPVTVEKEIEYGRMICKMIGYGRNSWAHICSGGTLANLEALWVARMVQFLPLCLQEVCERHKWNFEIDTPDCAGTGRQKNIRNINPKSLLALQSNVSLDMTRNLLKYLLSGKSGKTYVLDVASQCVKEGVDNSSFNIRNKGFAQVMRNLEAKCGRTMKPLLFVPESAHYSFRKAANILGYGEDAIRSIPITSSFRIDVKMLEHMLRCVGDGEYIAAVVCVVGTTEEGAVDPVHEVKWLRDRLSRELNCSFWLHVDSAWGGFVRTLFCDDYPNGNVSVNDDLSGVEDDAVRDFKKDIVLSKINRIGVHEDIYIHEAKKKVSIEWGDIEVCSAYMAMSSADSVTVDPHKLGYVPYPAGVVAFKNKLVTTLVAQDAPYISTSDDGFAQLDIPEINAVGSYIIEGSKPGAAALSCWFSAKMIPLDIHHHGKIIRTSLLNARRFAYYLQTYHNYLFRSNDSLLVEKGRFEKEATRPFLIKLLYTNIDTNVVCFMLIPTHWDKTDKSKMNLAGWNLDKANKLNEDIYSKFTINAQTRYDERKVTMSQRFFVSKTMLREESYNYNSVKSVLDDLGYTQEEYEKHGIFVMRLTVMNPWYYLTKMNNGTDYFREFLLELHYQSRKVIACYSDSPFLE